MERVKIVYEVEIHTKQLPQEFADLCRERFRRIVRDELYNRLTLYGQGLVSETISWTAVERAR